MRGDWVCLSASPAILWPNKVPEARSISFDRCPFEVIGNLPWRSEIKAENPEEGGPRPNDHPSLLAWLIQMEVSLLTQLAINISFPWKFSSALRMNPAYPTTRCVIIANVPMHCTINEGVGA